MIRLASYIDAQKMKGKYQPYKYSQINTIINQMEYSICWSNILFCCFYRARNEYHGICQFLCSGLKVSTESMSSVSSPLTTHCLVAWNLLQQQSTNQSTFWSTTARCQPCQGGSSRFNSKHKPNNPKRRTNIQIPIPIPTPSTRYDCIFASNWAKLMFLNGNESRNYRLSIDARIISKDWKDRIIQANWIGIWKWKFMKWLSECELQDLVVSLVLLNQIECFWWQIKAENSSI